MKLYEKLILCAFIEYESDIVIPTVPMQSTNTEVRDAEHTEKTVAEKDKELERKKSTKITKGRRKISKQGAVCFTKSVSCKYINFKFSACSK